MPMLKTMPRQVQKAPSFWKKRNSGNPVPGTAVIGKQGSLGRSVPARLFRSALHYDGRTVVSTADRALLKVEDESVHDRRSEELQKVAKSRERFVKQVKLEYNAERMWQTFQDTYQTQKISIGIHYGARKRNNKSANVSFFRAMLSNKANSFTFLPHSYNMYVHPKTTGKDPLKIEEGEDKFGWKNRHKESPFLREGPRTQISREIDPSTVGTDAKFYRPNNVGWNMAAWFHQNNDLRQKVYDHLRHQLRGHGSFHYQVGKGGTRRTQLVKWYQTLLNQDIPRIFCPSTSDVLKGVGPGAAAHTKHVGIVNSVPQRWATSRHLDDYQTVSNACFSGSLDRGFKRLERREYN